MLEFILLFAAVGFLAQIVDGALGMAYGLICSTVLLALGVPPATASASVHIAELFTTAASGGAHLHYHNVDFRMFWRLVPAGILGGILGAYVLTGVDAGIMRPIVVVYLGIMGLIILWRAIRPGVQHILTARATGVVGVVGGFSDAVGGGGWGPMVTSALMASGAHPRHVIGTVNTAEFLVAFTISATFVWALLSGHWTNAGSLMNHAAAVIGLTAGGVIAAPLAGLVVKRVPARVLAAIVGVVVLGLCAYQAWLLLG